MCLLPVYKGNCRNEGGVLRFFREIIEEFRQKGSFEEFFIEFLARLHEKEV